MHFTILEYHTKVELFCCHFCTNDIEIRFDFSIKVSMHILHNKEETLVTTISEYCTTSSNIACMFGRDDANITMYPPLCCPLLYIILSSLPLLTISLVQLSDLRAGDE